MIGLIRSRLGNDEGFTLVELMVVVLIIAILVAIAIPTFLGARSSAQDRAAQSDLRNALTAEKVFYVDNENYTADDALLALIEPSINWATAPDNVDVTVQVVGTEPVGSEQQVCLQILSSSGETFYLRDVAAGAGAGTFYGNATADGAVCTAAAATTADAGW